MAHLQQGMTKAAGSVEDSHSGVRLWAHEVLRVFYDRLIDEPDRLRVGRLLEELTEKHFKQQLGRLLGLAGAGGAAVADDELLGGLRGLIFGDFMVPGAGEACLPGRRKYQCTVCDELCLGLIEFGGACNVTVDGSLSLKWWSGADDVCSSHRLLWQHMNCCECSHGCRQLL